MNIKEFTRTLAEMVTEMIDGTAVATTVTKNNDTELDAITLKIEGSGVTPILYARDYYRDYENGATIEYIARKVARLLTEKAPDCSEMLTWDNLKYRVSLKLINQDSNQKMLEETPHIPIFRDLALVPYAKLELGGETGAAVITYKLADSMGITPDELLETARKNQMLERVDFRRMGSMLAELGGFPEEDDDPSGLWVLTNPDKTYGASVIARADIRRKIGYKLGSYFMIPSSIHEVLIIKAEDQDRDMLDQMVRDINGMEVRRDERLSNHVYYYDAETGLMEGTRA